MTEQKQKKPWYKRWWAILLFIFIGLGIIGNLMEEKEQTTITPIEKQQTVSVQSAKEQPQEPPKTQTKLISQMSDAELKEFFYTEEEKISKKELFELQPAENKLAAIVDKHDWQTAGPILERSLREWLQIRSDWVRILLIGKTYGKDWGDRFSIEALEGHIGDRDDLYFVKSFSERAIIVRSDTSPPYEQVKVPMFGLSAKIAHKKQEPGFENLASFLKLLEANERNPEVALMAEEARREFINEYNQALNTFDATIQAIDSNSGPCRMLKEQCQESGDCAPLEEARSVGAC